MIRLDEFTDTTKCEPCKRAETFCPRCKFKRCGTHLVESATLEVRRETREISGTRRVQGNLIGVTRNPALPPWVAGGEIPIFEEHHLPYSEEREFVLPVFVCLTHDGESIAVEAPEDSVMSAGWAGRSGECVRCRHDAMYEALSAVEAEKAERAQRIQKLQSQLESELELLENSQSIELDEFDRVHDLNLIGRATTRPTVPGWLHVLWVGTVLSGVLIPAIAGVYEKSTGQSADAAGAPVTIPIILLVALVATGVVGGFRASSRRSAARWDQREEAKVTRAKLVADHEREVQARRARFAEKLKAES